MSLVFGWRLTAFFSLAIAFVATTSAQQETVNSEASRRQVADWPLSHGNAESNGVAKCELAGSLRVDWERPISTSGFGAAAAVIETAAGKKMVLLSDLNGTLFALDLETGDELWHFEASLGFNAGAAWRDGRIYIGDMDGNFYCLDSEGKELWRYQAEAQIDSCAGFFGDSVLFTSQYSRLYSLNALTGAEMWKLDVGDQLQCSPTVLDGQVFLASCDGLLHIIDLETAKEIGSIDIQSPTGATPSASGKMLFLATAQAGLIAIDCRNRKIAWQFDGDGAQIQSTPAVKGNRVIIATPSRMVYCLNNETGEEFWKQEIKSGAESSPVIAGNRVFVTAGDGRIYGMELETGTIFWEHEFGGGFTASPAVAFEKLVVGTKRGTVICLGSYAESGTKQDK